MEKKITFLYRFCSVSYTKHRFHSARTLTNVHLSERIGVDVETSENEDTYRDVHTLVSSNEMVLIQSARTEIREFKG